nr:MAG TPA: hypothetical protein [Caudoviricetes sp.]
MFLLEEFTEVIMPNNIAKQLFLCIMTMIKN